jgi:hypothetical protein
VIANSEFQVLPRVYVFEPLRYGPERKSPEALACVRDGEQWSALVPATDARRQPGQFTIFSFHFNPKFDATGFRRLASFTSRADDGCRAHRHLRKGPTRGLALDHIRGGIFDYWGCPADQAEAVIAEVRALIDRGHRR